MDLSGRVLARWLGVEYAMPFDFVLSEREQVAHTHVSAVVLPYPPPDVEPYVDVRVLDAHDVCLYAISVLLWKREEIWAQGRPNRVAAYKEEAEGRCTIVVPQEYPIHWACPKDFRPEGTQIALGVPGSLRYSISRVELAESPDGEPELVTIEPFALPYEAGRDELLASVVEGERFLISVPVSIEYLTRASYVPDDEYVPSDQDKAEEPSETSAYENGASEVVPLPLPREVVTVVPNARKAAVKTGVAQPLVVLVPDVVPYVCRSSANEPTYLCMPVLWRRPGATLTSPQLCVTCMWEDAPRGVRYGPYALGQDGERLLAPPITMGDVRRVGSSEKREMRVEIYDGERLVFSRDGIKVCSSRTLKNRSTLHGLLYELCERVAPARGGGEERHRDKRQKKT
jgi:hypothetical protein